MIIDTHCHILWGVDDASKCEADTLKMLEIAEADGIDFILATSHIHPKFPNNNQATFHEAFLRVKALIAKHQLKIQVLEGAELYFNEERLSILEDDHCIPLHNTRYLLVELPWVHDESAMHETQIIQYVLDHGYLPIIAHPERYEVLHANPELVDEWIAMGCLMQVNRTSLLGLDSIPMANEFAQKMFEKNQIQIIGSDAHRATLPRVPVLSDVYEWIKSRKGSDVADALCGGNAERILLMKNN